uniref:Uncharacterized protein n=1 Tax=Podoviridae sp. cttxo15 TaxID=2826584 RepID=A0A8S5N1Y1_9CAUD|nr:MAG TPA: hypothetical protein [Podoviridae sp. cttxo15]
MIRNRKLFNSLFMSTNSSIISNRKNFIMFFIKF